MNKQINDLTNQHFKRNFAALFTHDAITQKFMLCSY